eukprot:TRINITY_DN1542_c0_g1_i10.p1 TRINITY_DN1542_c0_g1~~TRINITY_DN1542_c0_g1_i10.p1  ORF type:complete len:333 (-),score=126.57 TRINITY_DN1542_c0_g1_i10:135-1133(-)
MLDSYLDYGYPVINQRFVLESLIKPEGVFDKIEEVIVGRNQHLKENTGVLEKFVDTISDQRDYSLFRTTTSHISEEVLFDVIEYVDCVMDKNGNIISQEVNGEIKVESMINGPWLLNLFITAPNPLNDISVHESLYDTIDSLESEKVLSFIPSNGHYSLMFYNVKQMQMRLPFEVIHSISHDAAKKTARVDVKIESRLVRGQQFTVEDLHLKLFIPGGLNSKETTPTYGSVNYTDNNTSALWRIGELKKEQAAKLYIIFDKTDDYDPEFSNFTACLKFQVQQLSVSGTKVDKATFKDENVKATKRARAMTKSGYYEIRMQFFQASHLLVLFL